MSTSSSIRCPTNAVALCVVGVALAACGSRPAPARPADPDRDHVEEIADESDRCPYLPRHCLQGFDVREDDGCPDAPPPSFALPVGSAEVPDEAGRALDGVAVDVRRLVAGASLVIAVNVAWGESETETARRGALVVRALVARGVPADLIRVEVPRFVHEATSDRVSIEVVGCPPEHGVLDTDADGIPDHLDACPDDPEDVDGHLDEDGCPDVDYDCHPVDPEVDDGTCGDRDHDGVLDVDDRCPDDPGPRSSAGCPQPLGAKIP
ncbi:MAG TPA: hypothetical protein VML75_28515 [Kofleriaceae bacterium]|nr:hypothetical protein [Kofleriaceae bacterium]